MVRALCSPSTRPKARQGGGLERSTALESYGQVIQTETQHLHIHHTHHHIQTQYIISPTHISPPLPHPNTHSPTYTYTRDAMLRMMVPPRESHHKKYEHKKIFNRGNPARCKIYRKSPPNSLKTSNIIIGFGVRDLRRRRRTVAAGCRRTVAAGRPHLDHTTSTCPNTGELVSQRGSPLI